MGAYKIFLEIFLAMVGMGYWWSGKRHGNMRLMGCGIALGLFPYFVDGPWMLLLIGLTLVAFPIVFRGE